MKKIILSIIALLSVTVMEAQKNQTHLTLNNGVAKKQWDWFLFYISMQLIRSFSLFSEADFIHGTCNLCSNL